MSSFSHTLFARPTFVEGLGRIVDFAGTLSEYNYSADSETADRDALASDWYAVGDDLKASIENVSSEIKRGR